MKRSYIGITEFIDSFKDPFDEDVKAIKKAKANLQEQGIRATKSVVDAEVLLVKAEWQSLRDKGNNIHKIIQQRTKDTNPDAVMGIYKKADSNELMDAESINRLENGNVYIEKQIVSNHHMLIGYADKIEVKDNYINIEDIKTWKKIYKTSSYISKNGFKIPATYFYSPIDNLQTCNFIEAALQVSLYMYISWTYNKKLKPGKLTVRHIITNENDKIIGEHIIDLPYLRDEIKAMFKFKKINEN